MYTGNLLSRGMKRAATALFLLGVTGLGASASAAELRCDNCTEAGYEALAMTKPFGQHHVYDLARNQVRKYEIIRSCEPGEGCWTEFEPLPPDAQVVATVTQLNALYQQTNGTFKSWFNFDANGTITGVSAFDVIFPGGPRNNVANWLMNHPVTATTITAQAHSLGAAVASILRSANVTTILTVTFTDGSKASFSFEVVNGTITYVEGSAVDAYGNTIPSNMNQLNGIQFDYSGEGSNGLGPASIRMQNHLYTMFGVPVVSGSSSRIISWTCTLNGNGVVCRGR